MEKEAKLLNLSKVEPTGKKLCPNVRELISKESYLPANCNECKYCECNSYGRMGWCYMQDDIVDIRADKRNAGCPLERM